VPAWREDARGQRRTQGTQYAQGLGRQRRGHDRQVAHDLHRCGNAGNGWLPVNHRNTPRPTSAGSVRGLAYLVAEPLQQASFDALGLTGDRRWMLVDESNGRFFTQRALPQMSQLSVLWNARGGVTLSAPGI
nr:hypothetical protein [Tanacetum cinerariifolium]